MDNINWRQVNWLTNILQDFCRQIITLSIYKEAMKGYIVLVNKLNCIVIIIESLRVLEV